jgi:hypothetical protein
MKLEWTPLLRVFKQFNVPLNAVYTDGEIAKFSNAVRIENETLYLKETIERMVNPFLCSSFLMERPVLCYSIKRVS